MARERLLKRLQRWDDMAHPGMELDAAAYTESVLADLARLYNTRQGTVLIDPEYGLMDFTNLHDVLSPNDLEALSRDIRQATSRFEPRLNDVEVEYRPRGGEQGLLRFMVTARLSFRDQSLAMQYDIVLHGDGRVVIETQE